LGKRGPAPESLSKLFTLKYHEEVNNREVLAAELGVSVSTVRSYESRLRKKLATKSLQVSELRSVCPECFEPNFFEDSEAGEQVCRSCGLTLPILERDNRLPFGTTYALESDLAVGKSLGGSLPKRSLYQILARSNNGSEDLGIRARQIRILSETNEPPSLAKMLGKAYEVSKHFNLEGDFIFNNDLGRNVRRAFWLARELEININSAAETAFWITLCQHGNQKLILEAESQLKINQTLLGLILKLNHLLLTVKNETLSQDATRLSLNT